MPDEEGSRGGGSDDDSDEEESEDDGDDSKKRFELEECLKFLLDKGFDPNATNSAGETLLIHAIKEEKPKSIDMLLNLEKGLNVNKKNS